MSDPTVPTDRPYQPSDRTDHTDRPSVVTVAEAADILGIGRDAVWGRIKRGTLPRVEGKVGPAGEVYVDLSGAADRGKRGRGGRPSERSTAPTVPTIPSDHTDRPTVAAEPAIDRRDVELAAVRAERDALLDQRAYLKDQLVVRDEQMLSMREQHAREIEALADAIGQQAEMVRALQAQSLPPQLVEVGQTGNAPVRPAEGRQRTQPPFVDDETLKPPIWRRLWPFR